jgi:hypothetical protein
MQPIIPCEQNKELEKQIEKYADVLKNEAHTLGNHGLSEQDFYRLGVFQGAIERIRGQQSATMVEKRDFVKRVLDHMQDGGHIKEWIPAGDQNRHDYQVKLNDDRISVIELKGCLDGNNTTIYERPAHAQEFVIWSVCSNAGGDPRHNVWSGIHTRLSAEIIEHGANKHVDGLIVWDWLCGTVARPCPKLERPNAEGGARLTVVGPYKLPPPCIYLFPKTVPVVRTNANPDPHTLAEVGFLKAINDAFGGYLDEINKVRFLVAHNGKDTVRTTSIERDGQLQRASKPVPIRRR